MKYGIRAHVLLGNGIGLGLGAVIRIRGVSVDGCFVGNSGLQEVEFDIDLARILVRDAADVPDIVRFRLGKIPGRRPFG